MKNTTEAADKVCKAIILDTETTGIKSPVEPIEIAFLQLPALHALQDDLIALIQTMPAQQQRYKPTKQIEPTALSIHGIKMADLLHSPAYSAAALEAEIPSTTEYIIGHNISYDMRALRTASGGSTDSSFPYIPICTLKLAKQLWPDLASRSLTNLIQEFFPVVGPALRAKAHGALADCYLTACILSAAIEEYQPESWEDLAIIADPKLKR